MLGNILLFYLYLSICNLNYLYFCIVICLFVVVVASCGGGGGGGRDGGGGLGSLGREGISWRWYRISGWAILLYSSYSHNLQ